MFRKSPYLEITLLPQLQRQQAPSDGTGGNPRLISRIKHHSRRSFLQSFVTRSMSVFSFSILLFPPTKKAMPTCPPSSEFATRFATGQERFTQPPKNPLQRSIHKNFVVVNTVRIQSSDTFVRVAEENCKVINYLQLRTHC